MNELAHQAALFSFDAAARFGLTARRGRPLPTNLRSLTRYSLERLIAVSELPRIRFHDIRHTAASMWLAAGIHPKVVQERLGHASISITLDTYSHVLPTVHREAADRIGAMLRR